MSKSLVVYIAGPYTQGDPCINTKNAILVAEEVIIHGHIAIVPHLTHFWHTMHPHPYEYWMKQCLGLVKKADVVFRIEGESPGSDREVALARELKIPIVYSMSGLVLETNRHLYIDGN